jgi:hypothetical protein
VKNGTNCDDAPEGCRAREVFGAATLVETRARGNFNGRVADSRRAANSVSQ